VKHYRALLAFCRFPFCFMTACHFTGLEPRSSAMCRCLISERGAESEYVLLFVGNLAGQNKCTIFSPKILFPYLITLVLAVFLQGCLRNYAPCDALQLSEPFFLSSFTCATYARRPIPGIDSVSQKRPWIFLSVFTPAALLFPSLLCTDLLPLPSLCCGKHF